MNVGMCRRIDLSTLVTMTRVARPIMIGTALLIASLSLAGCSAAGSGSSHNISAGGGSSQQDAVAPNPATGSKSDSGKASTADRSVVVTGTMTVTAEKPLAAADEAVSIVEAAGGRVDGRTENAATDRDQGSATLVLESPTFDEMTAMCMSGAPP